MHYYFRIHYKSNGTVYFQYSLYIVNIYCKKNDPYCRHTGTSGIALAKQELTNKELGKHLESGAVKELKRVRFMVLRGIRT